MRKGIVALVALAAIGLSSATFAASLSDSMESLADNFKIVQQPQSPEAFNKALHEMRKAALESKTFTPKKLKGQQQDSEEMKAYHLTLDKLIAQIDKAIVFADKGKMDDGKQAAEGIKPIIGEGHKRFR